jgi:outer membrane protein TolC
VLGHFHSCAVRGGRVGRALAVLVASMPAVSVHAQSASYRSPPASTSAVTSAAGAELRPAVQASEPAPPLTLDDVYAILARRNPRIRAAVEGARAAGARVGDATRPPDPTLQLGLMNYMLPALAPDPTLGMVQLQVMQMLPGPGKLAASGAAAVARTEAARARARETLWETRSRAAMAYYERYQSAGSAAIARDTRGLLENLADVSSAMYRVGQGRQADVLRARVEIARMGEEVVRMEAMLDGATARLAAVLDTASEALSGPALLPAFPDSIPSIESLERLAQSSRPMLAAGAADVRAAIADARRVRRELWPDLQVGVQYGQRRAEMGTDRMGSLMLGATLPVFARSRQLRMREEAQAMQAMAEADLAAMWADTRSQLAETRATLVSSRRLRTLYRTTVLPQAEAATTSSFVSYRAGSIDLMTVLDNRMKVNRYQQELLALDAAEGRAWAELEMLVGGSLLDRSIPSSAPGAEGVH